MSNAGTATGSQPSLCDGDVIARDAPPTDASGVRLHEPNEVPLKDETLRASQADTEHAPLPFGDNLSFSPQVHITRYGFDYWRSAVICPVAAILLVLWLGVEVVFSLLGLVVFLALVAFGFIPIWHLRSEIQSRRKTQRDARRHAAEQAVVAASPPLTSTRDRWGIAVVAAEWFVLIAMFVVAFAR